jgi:predicted glycoside hydrolase/deacetylase ChbG (UPF0249 family)
MCHSRCLIVNADDFGQSSGVNEGIITAHERGIVTSASLMVRWPAAAEATDYARKHAPLSLGLHLDLGEWIYRNGTWLPLYEVVSASDAAAVAREIERQFTAFENLVGKSPTHLDSHQHCHREEPVRGLLADAARRLGVPLRGCHPAIRYCGDFYGQTDSGKSRPEAIAAEELLRIIKGLQPGCTELACHPGLGDLPEGMYRHERKREVETLCDPRVRAALHAEGIHLCSFADLLRHL